MMTKYTAVLLAVLALQQVGAAPDPLKIPDSDVGLPGAGPLRRSEWFRGVWRDRRQSWLGGAPRPIVQTQFDRTQNLLRTLAGLSHATGDPK